MYFKQLFAFLVMFISLQSYATETEWLELKKGIADKTTGTAIREIINPNQEGQTSVVFSIPKNMLKDTSLEEVVVYGKAEDGNIKESVIPITYEWLKDFENDNYGLLIRFGNTPLLPIRLYFKSINGNKVNP